MKHPRLLSLLAAGVILATSAPAFADDDEATIAIASSKERFTVAPVGTFRGRGRSAGSVDGTSVLYRTKTGVGFTLNTASLAAGVPYTAWWVVFNRPQRLTPFACEGGDLQQPRRQAGRLLRRGPHRR